MKMRGRIDSNQREIVVALRKAGCGVQILASVGNGCPDLVAARAGKTVMLECKSRDGELTDDQERWHSRWPGAIAIVRTPAEALRAMGL